MSAIRNEHQPIQYVKEDSQQKLTEKKGYINCRSWHFEVVFEHFNVLLYEFILRTIYHQT